MAGTPSAAATAATAAAAAAAATAASPPSHLFTKPRLCGIFLVEDVERPQADVGDLFLANKDFMTR